MATVIGLVYAALSLMIGGMSATIVLWKPGLFERASAERNLPLPKTLYELLSFGFHMALFWPLLVLMSIRDRRGAQ
jgi:hypothetical protein